MKKDFLIKRKEKGSIREIIEPLRLEGKSSIGRYEKDAGNCENTSIF